MKPLKTVLLSNAAKRTAQGKPLSASQTKALADHQKANDFDAMVEDRIIELLDAAIEFTNVPGYQHLANSEGLHNIQIATQMFNDLTASRRRDAEPKPAQRQMSGSLANRIMEAAEGVDPHSVEVGMGCTILMFTDRKPATVVEVIKRDNGKVHAIVIQEDRARRLDKNGFSESQDYEYTPNTDAFKATYTLRSNNRFVRKYDDMNTGQKVFVGKREKYHDFSF